MVSNDGLDELEALFEEDEFNEEINQNDQSSHVAKSPVANVSTSPDSTIENLPSMEEEYHQLQRQMEILQEKMKMKLGSQTFDAKTSNVSSNSKMDEQDGNKRSFCSAFAPSCGESYAECESTTSKEINSDDRSGQLLKTFSSEQHEVPSTDLKTVAKHSSSHTGPPQKKLRVAHQSQQSSASAELKRTLPTKTFFTQGTLPLKPKNKQKLNNEENVAVEYFSRIRLKQRYLSGSEFKQRMDGKMHLKLSLVRPTMNLSEDRDWVTVAVVAKQLDPQTAKNGKQFSIWHLTDLDDCTKHVALFLFGNVHKELWRNVTVGTVIGLLNPSIMPPKKESSNSGKSYDNTPALTVDVAERVMKIGVAADLGWCTATKFRNKKPAGKCLAFINKQYGDVCVYHMQSKYKKMSAKRGELQGSSSAPVASKYKHTLWNKVKGEQFFYGGQTFSATSPSLNSDSQKKEPKMKLTKIFSSINNMPAQAKNPIQERSKIMQAISGIEGNQAVSGCSDTFAEMLTSGDMVAGSRQFLNHLQKKEKSETKNAILAKGLSPAEFLKQQKELIENRKNELLRKSTSKDSVPLKEKNQSMNGGTMVNGNAKKPRLLSPAPTPSRGGTNKVEFTTAEELKKSTEILMKMKRERLLQQKKKLNSQQQNLEPLSTINDCIPQGGNAAPRLGSDVKDEKDVDLYPDWLSAKSCLKMSQSSNTPTLAELRKRKAIAKLKGKDGRIEIKKSDPNAVVKINSEKASEILKEKVQENRRDLLNENVENQEEKPSSKVFGNSKISDAEFNKILNASSSHSIDLDLEEMERQEKYFNPLVRKEMMEKKMEDTTEVASKVVSCLQCDYTFWTPHDRCKQLNHILSWKNVKKRFFECTNCKQRTTTWEPYPARACRECGSEKKWRRTGMSKSKTLKLDSEILHIRGVEHDKFLNAIR